MWEHMIKNAPEKFAEPNIEGTLVRWTQGWISLPYKQRALIIYDNDVTLKNLFDV